MSKIELIISLYQASSVWLICVYQDHITYYPNQNAFGSEMSALLIILAKEIKTKQASLLIYKLKIIIISITWTRKFAITDCWFIELSWNLYPRLPIFLPPICFFHLHFLLHYVCQHFQCPHLVVCRGIYQLKILFRINIAVHLLHICSKLLRTVRKNSYHCTKWDHSTTSWYLTSSGSLMLCGSSTIFLKSFLILDLPAADVQASLIHTENSRPL